MSRRAGVVALVGMTLTLAAAVLLLPWPIASWWTGTSWAGPHGLAAAVGDGLLADWSHGVAVPGDAGSALADPTRFWRWFHVVKAILAGVLLVAAALLAFRSWDLGRRARTRPRRAGARMLGIGSGAVAAVALLMVVANVQGALAPLSSVLSFLPLSSPDAATRDAIDALRVDVVGPEPASTALTLVRDFSAYHAVVAVLAAVITIAAIVAGARLWRQRRRAVGLLLLVPALGFAVLTAANVSTAISPAPALAAFLNGAV